jgi:hypothetical protein
LSETLKPKKNEEEAMKRSEEAIQEYREANQTRRLHLYLQSPDLRATFYDMEVRERGLRERERESRHPGPCSKKSTTNKGVGRFLHFGLRCRLPGLS